MACGTFKAHVLLIVFLPLAPFLLFVLSLSRDVGRLTSDPGRWDSRFRFVPINLEDCSELFGGRSELSAAVVSGLRRHTAALRKATGVRIPTEGYTARVPAVFKAYLELASDPDVGTICETGFNAGHSALGWLMANGRARVYAFDVGRHRYSRPMAEYLLRLYPDRLHVTWGDSRISLPEFRQRHPDVTCDLIVIDGGHSAEVCKADLLNFKQMAHRDSLVILDNYPQRHGNYSRQLGQVWEWAKRNGQITEMFRCRVKGKYLDLGFSVARYIMCSS